MVHTFKFKSLFIILIALIASMSLSGCYWNQTVENTNVGLRMPDGVTIAEIVPAGRYTDWGTYSSMVEMDITNKTINWEDKDLVTKDKQPIGVALSLTYSRKQDSESAKKFFMRYRSEAVDDGALQKLVVSRIPEVAKSISAKYTIDQMLGIAPDTSREQVAAEIKNLLKSKLDEIQIDLVSVQLNNISPSESYRTMLEEKAKSQLAVELAKQQTITLNEQLKQVEAQNQINLSKAKNANEVAAESAKALSDPRLYRLKQLEALKDIFGNNTKWILCQGQTGCDPTLILDDGTNNKVVPVPSNP